MILNNVWLPPPRLSINHSYWLLPPGYENYLFYFIHLFEIEIYITDNNNNWEVRFEKGEQEHKGRQKLPYADHSFDRILGYI